jgi:GNAT superfamily N-acetyltransferase
MEIIDYHPELANHFDAINRAWIKAHFTVEPIDHDVLTHPEERIIQPGGAILFARIENEIVGTVALMKHGEETIELTKMGVYEAARNKGIGKILLQAAIQKARNMGFKRLILYSNRKLENAIHLYGKYGFTEFTEQNTHYVRCDIMMEMRLID